MKLYSNIITNVTCNTFKLQNQLDKLAKWASVWQLPISHSKCCVLTVGCASRHFQQQFYVIDEHAIQSVSSVVNLGVTVNHNLRSKFGIERHPYTKIRIDQIPCMYVCMYNYSSQTTEPICIKIYQQIERLTLIAIRYSNLKYLPPPYLKPPKTHFWGSITLN